MPAPSSSGAGSSVTRSPTTSPTRAGRTSCLLDKGPLPNPGGSTGHASNFIYPVDHSKEMTQLTLESMRQYKEMGVFTECGGVEVARTEERLQELTRRVASAKAWGIEPVSLVTPAEVKELVPFIDETVILGGFYTPSVGVVDSLRAGTIMRERGHESGRLSVFASTEVLGLDVESGRIRRVRTTAGDIETEVVVIACGVWSPKLARMAGASIPLTPAVHQMIDIGPTHWFADAKGDIEFPIVRDMDTNMYERQHGSGLEIGSYAHRAILYDPEDLPSVEEASLSPTEFPFTQEDFNLQMEQALELMPSIVGDETVGIKHAINGILSLTPDGMPILGELPEVKGLWSAAAVWIKEGPGVGKSLAEWMVHGESHIDLHSSDAARFWEHQRSSVHVKARTAEGFNKTYGIVHPLEQWASNRDVRLSPYHQREQELGAVFFEAAGWERPQWYESNAPLLEEYGDRVGRREAEWDTRWWSPIINAEHLAMRDRAGIFDLSAFAIFDVSGPGALDALQTVSMRQVDVAVGKVVYTPWLSASGGFKSDLTIMRLGDEHFRVVTGGAHGMADHKWLRDHVPADGSTSLTDLTSEWSTLGLWGPRARDILASVTSDDVSHEGFPFATWKAIEVGPVEVLASRISYVGDLGWELYVPMEHGAQAVGRALGGRTRARCRALRDRRLRDDRSSREVLPRLRGRARERVHGRRGGHGLGHGQGAGLRRQGGARLASRRGAGRGPVHAHGRRPCVVLGGRALPDGPRADPHACRRTARRREGSSLLRDERRSGALGGEARAHGVPPARARRGRAARSRSSTWASSTR